MVSPAIPGVWQPYGRAPAKGQVSHSVYLEERILASPGRESGFTSEDRMGGIAIALFVALFAFGGKYFGWDDPDSKVRLAMAACFVLGALGAYRARS
jgi:hypothetical protein